MSARSQMTEHILATYILATYILATYILATYRFLDFHARWPPLTLPAIQD